MSDYKVGDKVRCIGVKGCSHIQAGVVTKVGRKLYHVEFQYISDEKNSRGSFQRSRVRTVRPEQIYGRAV